MYDETMDTEQISSLLTGPAHPSQRERVGIQSWFSAPGSLQTQQTSEWEKR